MIGSFADSLTILFADSYRRGRWMWHVAAALSTAILVLSGADWWVWQNTRAEWLYPLIMLAGVGGFFVPVLTPVLLYWAGEWRKSARLRHLAATVAHAAIVAWCISSAYKALTGRIEPEFLTSFGSVDISRHFNFGFLEHGIFWGWPSSHTAVAVAMAAALWVQVRHPLVRGLVAGWAAVVATGAGLGFHWFSDAVAGAIVGVVVGVAAARLARN